MARITVEDCLARIPNLFDLVLTASKRSRRLANGAESMVEWENDKPTVVALREIAAGHVDIDILEESDQQQALDAVFEDNAAEEAAAAPDTPPLLASRGEAKASNDAEVRVAAEPAPEAKAAPEPTPEPAAEPAPEPPAAEAAPEPQVAEAAPEPQAAEAAPEPQAATEADALPSESISPEAELAALLGATPDPEPAPAAEAESAAAEPEVRAEPSWQPEPQSYAVNESDAPKEEDDKPKSDSTPE